MRRLVHRTLFALALGLAAFSIPAEATMVRVANLQDLVEQSDRIFVGTCVGEAVEELGGILYTSYTFEVSEGVKGVDANTVVTVRQFGVSKLVPVGNGLFRGPIIEGMPNYGAGEKMMLFLVPESKIGLSSPVGLKQGVFSVYEKGGRDVLVNDVNNLNLYRNLTATWMESHGVPRHKFEQLRKNKGGDLEYNDFIHTVRRIVEVSQ